MKRFQNIMVVYDLVPGCDETLQRAVDLATRNRAQLRIVHAVNPFSNAAQTIAERRRLVDRVCAGIFLPDAQKSAVVRQGPPAESILKLSREHPTDLIVTPDADTGLYAKFLGRDTSTELLRRADCPVWIVRPEKTVSYRRIVAAVNAGKPDALSCPANRRILEIGSSLAILERAELHLVYAWDYEGRERDMMLSELPPGRHADLSEQARLKNLGHIVELVEHVLGDDVAFTPVSIRGNPHDVVIDHIATHRADLLIVDGKLNGPLKSAFIENSSTQILHQAACSILFTRPLPTRRPAVISNAA